MKTEQQKPNPFQAAAMRRMAEVLRGHGISSGEFLVNHGAKTAFFTTFPFAGEEHSLAIYDDEINMQQGPNLFESYMPGELESEHALIEGFATRLDRYLSGGPWEGADEKDLPRLFKEKLGRLLGR